MPTSWQILVTALAILARTGCATQPTDPLVVDDSSALGVDEKELK
jgi:hypothetical protein